MSDKPKYRFNHKTGEWDQLYRVCTDVSYISGFIDPRTGIPRVMTLPRSLATAMTNN
jgi:hypothetical protein